jgi:hypothetical protein
MNFRTFHENVYALPCNSFGTGLVDGARLPASGSFIPVSEYVSFVFLIKAGDLNSATTFTVYQDKGATETAAIKVIANAAVLVPADGDNKLYSIEVATEHLDIKNGFAHVTLVPSGPAGGDDYADIVFLGLNPRRAPVTQPSSYASAVVVAG